MTTGFEAVTPQRAVQIMRAWAFHSWPMSVRDGIDVYTSFGFSPHPQEPQLFTSDTSPDEADSFFTSEGDQIDSVHASLSKYYPQGARCRFPLPSPRGLRGVRGRFHRGLGAPEVSQGQKGAFLLAVVLGQRRRRVGRRQ